MEIWNFIKSHWYIISFCLMLIFTYRYVNTRQKKVKYKYSDHFINTLNKEYGFLRSIRLRDIKRTKNLFSKKKINFIGGDVDDTTSFAIAYVKKIYGDSIIGIDCSLEESSFLSIINEIMYFFRYNNFLTNLVDTLAIQIIKDENTKNKNINDTMERIAEICKKDKYVVVFLNLNKNNIGLKYLNDRLFLSFMKKIPNLIITSTRAITKNDKTVQRFWLSGIDYQSFCAVINHKFFKSGSDIFTEKTYQNETVRNMTLREFNPMLTLYESNKYFYTDTYTLIKTKTEKFDFVRRYLDYNERDKSIPLIDIVPLKREIMKEFDTIMPKLNNTAKTLLALLYDFNISLYDKDLFKLYNMFGCNYFLIKDYLLDLGAIEEMHPEKYCNLIWESDLLKIKNPQLYQNLFSTYFTKEGTVLDYSKLPFNIDALCDLTCCQRSSTHTGIYMAPLLRSYLSQRGYDFSKTKDLSVYFVKVIKDNIRKDKTNIRKKMSLNRLITILTAKQQPISNFFDIYIDKLGDIVNTSVIQNYYSYLLSESIKFEASYYSIIANEAAAFFKGDLYLYHLHSHDTNKKLSLNLKIIE